MNRQAVWLATSLEFENADALAIIAGACRDSCRDTTFWLVLQGSPHRHTVRDQFLKKTIKRRLSAQSTPPGVDKTVTSHRRMNSQQLSPRCSGRPDRPPPKSQQSQRDLGA